MSIRPVPNTRHIATRGVSVKPATNKISDTVTRGVSVGSAPNISHIVTRGVSVKPVTNVCHTATRGGLVKPVTNNTSDTVTLFQARQSQRAPVALQLVFHSSQPQARLITVYLVVFLSNQPQIAPATL